MLAQTGSNKSKSCSATQTFLKDNHKDQTAMNSKINSGGLSLQNFGTLRAKSDAQTFQQYPYFL